MFCNLCGKEFEPWENRWKELENEFCSSCSDSRFIRKMDRDTFCVLCGSVLPKTKRKTISGRIIYTSGASKKCPSCVEYLKSLPALERFCIVCGAKITPGKNKKYCEPCKANRKQTPSEKYLETHRKTSLRWQKKNPEKQKAEQIARYYAGSVEVIYECSCTHPRKHNHHFDYSRPFEVIRLCPSCHGKEHKRLRKLEQPTPIEACND